MTANESLKQQPKNIVIHGLHVLDFLIKLNVTFLKKADFTCMCRKGRMLSVVDDQCVARP